MPNARSQCHFNVLFHMLENGLALKLTSRLKKGKMRDKSGDVYIVPLGVPATLTSNVCYYKKAYDRFIGATLQLFTIFCESLVGRGAIFIT